MTQHPFHIFECLRALNSVVFLPVRDYSVYDKLLHLNTMTFGKYIKYFAKHEWPYWLEVRRPDFDSYPLVPSELAEWLGDWGGQTPGQPPKVRKYYKNSNEFWTDAQVDFSAPVNSGITGERFDAQPERVLAWLNWLKKEWEPWAYTNLERFNAIETYEKFFSLFSQLQRHENQYELIVANAVLLWRFDSTEIRHPLLTQKMELEYLPEQGVFSLVAKSAPPRLEYDMLYDLAGIDSQKLFHLEQQLFEQPVDLRDKGFMETFSSRFADIIGCGCVVSDEAVTDTTAVTSQPCIYYDEPVVFLRRQDGRKWRGELEGIAETIDTGVSLPEMFSSYYANTKLGEEVSGRNWKDNLSQPFFPWDAQAAHKDILRKIADNPLTVVQAPPKSSKDKLAANLLVHLLAHGKKVLLTGSSNGSLKKISNLIYKDFPELASLCVSATGTDRENTRELLSSLRAHSQKMSYNSKEEIARELAELQKKLGVFQQDLTEDKLRLQSSRELEFSRRFEVEGQELHAWQVAKWLVDNKERLGYIPDEIGYDKECPLSKSDMNRLFDMLEQVSFSEGERLMLWLPKQDDLMGAKELSELFDTLSEFSAGRDDRKALLEECIIFAELDSAAIKEVLLEYQQALSELPGMDGGWVSVVLRDIAEVPQKLRVWQELYQSMGNSLQKVQGLLTALSEHAVLLPESFDYRQLRDALYKLRVEFYKNNKLSIFFKLSAGKKVLGVYDACTIDGAKAQSVKDVDMLLAKVDYFDELRKISARWNNAVLEVEGPRVEAFEPAFVDVLTRYCAQIKRAVDWRKKYLVNLKSSWEKFASKQPANWTDRNWLAEMMPKIQAWMDEKRFEELTDKLMQQYGLVIKNSGNREAHPLCYRFKEAIDEKSVALWQECRKKLGELEERKRAWLDLEFLHDKLSELAPLWAQQIVKQDEGGFAAQPQEWPLAWKYAQAKSWLKRHREGNQIEEITKTYYQSRDKEKEIIRDIAAKSAWYWQLKRITAEEKRALTFLLSKNDLQYIDNFNNEPAYEFLREADFWRLSLPAWIMPIDILLETAGPFDRLFDVVIVVDSEKCDIFSSCLLLRGKKAVIMGDNQLPGALQSAQGRVAANLLLEKSLLGLPDRVKFDLNDNLYNFMLRLNEDQHLLLDEHKLQPEEINDFINKNFYSEKLCLVPQAGEETGLTPSISQVVVEERKLAGSSNEQEALAVISKLTELMELPEYSEKTFAVLTLGADEQQDLLEQFIVEKIAEESLARRKIICSSLNGYQGGSRDVVLLSLVSAKTAQLADVKKLNAALNLAREQLYVFASFTQEDLSSYSVICRLLSSAPAYEEKLAADALFEQFATPDVVRDIYREIQEAGYDAQAEAVCGNLPLRLELVAQSGERKIALVLDGIRGRGELDELFAEEEALLRRGWQVWHLRACDFYIDKEAFLSKLFKLLDKSLLRRYSRG